MFMRAARHPMSRRSTIVDRRCRPGSGTSPAVRRERVPLVAHLVAVAMTTRSRRSIPGRPNICVDNYWGTNMGTNRASGLPRRQPREKIESERAQQHPKQDGQPYGALLDKADDHDHGKPK